MRTINHVVNGMAVTVTIGPDDINPLDLNDTVGTFTRVSGRYSKRPGERLVTTCWSLSSPKDDGGLRRQPAYAYDFAGAVRSFRGWLGGADAAAAANAEFSWLQDYYHELWSYCTVTVADAYGNESSLHGVEVRDDWAEDSELISGLAEIIAALAYDVAIDFRATLARLYEAGRFLAYLDSVG